MRRALAPRFATALRPAAFVAPASAAVRWHGGEPTGDRTKPLKVKMVLADGARKQLTCYVGQNLLDVAREHDINVEGACDGSCACSTCHVYLDDESYERMEKRGDEPSDAEGDMLDMAFFPEPTSRLGCQVFLKAEDDGIEVRLPKATRNFAVDGYVPTPH
jgi:ferredoxin